MHNLTMAVSLLFGLLMMGQGVFGLPSSYTRVEPDDAVAQTFLRKYNYLPKYQDGSLEEAVRNFQRFIHTYPSGRVDGETMEWFEKARCGMPDMEDNEHEGHRKKRYVLHWSSWDRTSLTYKILVYSGDLPYEVEDRIFADAFAVWSAVSPLQFTSLSGTGLKADINIVFVDGYHGDSQPFDGPGKILAHAYFPANGGDQHYDKAEQWTHQQAWGRNLFQTAVHEIGHSLGLRHSNVKNAVMFPYISSYHPFFRLHEDDIFAIRAVYGDICGPSRPCLNSGTCFSEGIIASCKCTPGFSGKNCEIKVDPCVSKPCHGGVCMQNGHGFRCECLAGYTGRYCRSKIDHCTSKPCQNGGICEGSSRAYLCQCPNGYTGNNCEFQQWHICNIRPCYNGGSCRAVQSDYECDCLPAFTGLHCEYLTSTMQAPTRGTQSSFCTIPPLDAVTTSSDSSTYFFKGDLVYALINLNPKPGYPKRIPSEFPYVRPGPVSAALYWDEPRETWLFQGEDIFIFYNNRPLRSMKFSPSFPGVPFPLDGAFFWPFDGSAYLIKGTKYWKVDLRGPRVIEDSRDLSEWGLSQPVDAIVLYSDNLYAFENENYYRISLSTKRVDHGYPKNIARRWFQC